MITKSDKINRGKFYLNHPLGKGLNSFYEGLNISIPYKLNLH